MPVLVLGAGCDRVPGAVGLVERICCSLNGDSYGVLIISAELAVRAFETGCRCWVPVLGALVLVLGAVSWSRRRVQVRAAVLVLGAVGCVRGGDTVPVLGGSARGGDSGRR